MGNVKRNSIWAAIWAAIGALLIGWDPTKRG